MKNEWSTNRQDVQIQQLLDRCLPLQIPNEDSATRETHLDDDSLAAFVEGKTNERETAPIVKHLVACSFCRHITAELIKLDFAFAEVNTPVPANENQPSKISEVLSALLSKIFVIGDEAVFAHEEKKEITDQAAEQNSEDNLE